MCSAVGTAAAREATGVHVAQCAWWRGGEGVVCIAAECLQRQHVVIIIHGSFVLASTVVTYLLDVCVHVYAHHTYVHGFLSRLRTLAQDTVHILQLVQW